VTAEALLPGGPYDLWRAGDTAHRLKDLVEAFAQFSHLPKMLNRKAIQDTLLEGCRAGVFVFRLTRPDQSYRTFWRELPDEIALRDPALEVALPETATLAALAPALLVPGVLPELWQGDELTLADLYAYFSGRVVQVSMGGYAEPVAIPRAGREIVDGAVLAAVKEQRLWLLAGRGSFFAEDVPKGVLADDASVQRPPQPIAHTEILPTTLPEAWRGNESTTALDIANALSAKVGKILPWYTVRQTIDAAMRARWLETTADSGPWPCAFSAARSVHLSLPSEPVARPASTPPPSLTIRESAPAAPGMLVAAADLQEYEIQNLAEQVGQLTKEAVGLNLSFHLRVELGPAAQVSEATIAQVNELLAEVSEKLRLRKE
ncbi:MAG: hypothetical protein WCD86_27475, partial [Ktedonobacteraceae bacterium]